MLYEKDTVVGGWGKYTYKEKNMINDITNFL